MKRAKGMTLIEIIVSMAIYAVIALLLSQIMMTVNATIRNTNSLNKRLTAESYYADNGIGGAIGMDMAVTADEDALSSIVCDVPASIDGSTRASVTFSKSDGTAMQRGIMSHASLYEYAYQDEDEDFRNNNDVHYKFLSINSASSNGANNNEALRLSLQVITPLTSVNVNKVSGGVVENVTKVVITSTDLANPDEGTPNMKTFPASKLNLETGGKASLLKVDDEASDGILLKRGFDSTDPGSKDKQTKKVHITIYGELATKYQGAIFGMKSDGKEGKTGVNEVEFIDGDVEVMSHKVGESSSQWLISFYETAICNLDIATTDVDGHNRPIIATYDVNSSAISGSPYKLDK